MTIKERIIKLSKNIDRWMRENKAIFVSILLLMLCFGMMDNVTTLMADLSEGQVPDM